MWFFKMRTIREALKQNVRPAILAKAVLGAICYIIRNNVDAGFPYPGSIEELNAENVRSIIIALWKNKPLDDLDKECLELIVGEHDDFVQEFLRSRTR